MRIRFMLRALTSGRGSSGVRFPVAARPHFARTGSHGVGARGGAAAAERPGNERARAAHMSHGHKALEFIFGGQLYVYKRSAAGPRARSRAPGTVRRRGSRRIFTRARPRRRPVRPGLRRRVSLLSSVFGRSGLPYTYSTARTATPTVLAVMLAVPAPINKQRISFRACTG